MLETHAYERMLETGRPVSSTYTRAYAQMQRRPYEDSRSPRPFMSPVAAVLVNGRWEEPQVPEEPPFLQ